MHYWMGSLLAVAVGFVLDLLLGDPNSAYHPICLIGRLIAFTEKKTRALFPKTEMGERTAGGVTAFLVVLILSSVLCSGRPHRICGLLLRARDEKPEKREHACEKSAGAGRA